MKVFVIVLFVGLCSFALIKADMDSTKDKIMAAVQKLKTDQASGKAADTQLIEDLTVIMAMINGHMGEVPAENQPKVLAFIAQVEASLLIMQASKKFDPKVIAMFESFGKSMTLAA